MKYVLGIALFLLFFSCTSTQKLLSRTWKVTDVELTDSLNLFNPEQEEMIKNALKQNVVFEFLPNSSYQIKSAGETHTGKWEIAKGRNIKSFSSTSADNKQVAWTIMEISRSRLVAEMQDNMGLKTTLRCSAITD